MQLLGILLMIGLLILLLLVAIYLARGQTSHKTPYGSWSDILGSPNGPGRTMDATEQVLNKIASEQGHHHRKRSH